MTNWFRRWRAWFDRWCNYTAPPLGPATFTGVPR